MITPMPAADDTITLRLTGAPALCLAGGQTRPLDPHGALIAARLVLAGPQPRAQLAALLYPGVDDARARANLRQRLLRLKALAGQVWVDGADTLQLQPGVAVAPLADGSLLDGVPLPESDELAAWLQAQRSVLQLQRASSLQAALQAAEAAQRLDEALALAARWVALDPAAEAPRRTLARLHYLNHDRAQALAQLDQLDAVLQAEHGAAPSEATRALRRVVEAARAPEAAAPASVALLRPPRLVGRDAELRQANRALAEGRALLLLGEAGLGKSRLIAELLAQRPGAPAVKAQAGDGGVPYATLARLLRRLLAGRGLPPQAGALQRVLPELRDATVPLLPDGARLLLLQAAAALLDDLAPPLVAVDDLHFADDASLELLQGLVDADPRRPWLLAQRPGEGPAAATTLQHALIDAGRLQPLALQPLPPDGVAALLHDLALPGLDAATIATWAPRLHRHTGGNPLFVLETLQQLQHSDIASGRLPHSASVGALIDRRLRTLGERALALARLAAIAGPDFSPALAEAVLQRPALDLADGWAELEAAQVLRDGGFAHDLVQDAVLRSVPAAIARHLHAAVARHLESLARTDGTTAEPARLAAHWLAAADDRAALPWLLRAADAAHAGLRPREEAGFLATAAGLTQAGLDAAGRFELLMRWQQAAETGQDRLQALAILDRAEPAGDAQRARWLARRAYLLGEGGDVDACSDLAEQALALALALADTPLAADALSSAAAAHALANRNARAHDLLERHWPLMERLPMLPVDLLTTRAQVVAGQGHPREAHAWFQRALQASRSSGNPVLVIRTRVSMARNLMVLGDIAEADAALADAEQLHAQHEGLAQEHHGATGLRASTLRDLGRYDAALAAYQASIDAESDPRSMMALWQRVQRAQLWLAIGQYARAVQDLDAAAPDERPPWFHAGVLIARARMAQARGQAMAPWLDEAEALLADDPADFMAVQAGLLRALAGAPAAPLLALAERCQYGGFVLSLRWVAAQAAARAGRAADARALAATCDPAPAGVLPRGVPQGLWWHGLWQLWRTLGDAGRAEAARAEGVAWIHRTLQHDLAAPFHPAFRDAVPAHRALLAG